MLYIGNYIILLLLLTKHSAIAEARKRTLNFALRWRPYS